MFTRFWSKAQMRLYIPLDRFEDWPEDTFSFCPKCGMDSFELLFEVGTETYIRCRVCGSLWVSNSALGLLGQSSVPGVA